MYDEQHIPQAHLVGHLDAKTYDGSLDEDGSIKDFVNKKIMFRDNYFKNKNQTAFIATFRSHTWLMTIFASCVGPGMLSGLIVPMGESESQKEKVEEEEKMKKAFTDVSGIVTLDLGPSESGADLQDLAVDEKYVPGAGILILMKICGALVASGYEQDTIVKVGRLVSRNLITSAAWGPEFNDKANDSIEPVFTSIISKDLIAQKVQKILKDVLDPKVERPRRVQVNSNEPVLLINVEHKINKITQDRLVEATIDTLHSEWNIWPVRIYVHTMLAALESTFSITLLNVVNTDIGGPSMVQLLDMPCDVPEWNDYLLRESWRDRNLISREETQMKDVLDHGSSESDEASLSSSILSSALAEEEEEEDQIESGAAESAEKDTLEHDNPPNTKAPADIDLVASVSKEKELSSIRGGEQTSGSNKAVQSELPSPEMTLSQSEETAIPTSFSESSKGAEKFTFDERDIEYPTWQHTSKSESLADLIRTQAIRLGLATPAKDVPIVEGNSTKEAEDESDNESIETDEGFELVRAQ